MACSQLERLQADVDEWLEQYSREHPQTFRETKHLAQTKPSDILFEGHSKPSHPINVTAVR